MKPSGLSEQIHDGRREGDGDSRPFALLRYFSLASLLAVVVASVLLGAYFRQVAVNSLVEAGEAHNVRLAHAFINALWPEFAPLIAETKGLGGEQIRGLPRTARVKQAVADHAQGLPVIKVKLYTLDGRTVFSSEPSQIGEDKSGNAGFAAARDGRVASELVYRDKFSAFEQVIERANLLSSYVPVFRSGASRVEAVFELYSDVTPFVQSIHRVEKAAIAGVLAVFSVLYAVLFVIARRAEHLLAAQAAKRQLRLITDNIPVMLSVVGLDERFKFVNRRYEEGFGRKREEIVGQRLRDVIGEAAYARAAPALIRALAGEHSTFERPHVFPGGESGYVEVTQVPDLDSEGRIQGFYALIIDITQHKRVEEALRRSQQLLEMLFAQSLDGFFFMTLDEPMEWRPGADNKKLLEYALDHEHITRVNSAMSDIYSVPADRFLGRTPRDIFRHDLEYARDWWYDMFEHGHLKTENLFRKADGTPIWVEGDYICLYDAEGRITGHFGVERDVTSRKRAEVALRESEQRFRDVVNAGGEYVWEADAEWRYTYVSDQFEAMLGYPSSEVLGRKPADFMPAGEAERVNDWFRERSLEGRLFRGLEHMSIAKSGAGVWQQVSGVPVKGPHGGITGYRGTGRDITDKRLAEERIEHLATRDSLTGLPNRVLLNDRLEQALVSAQRNGEMVALLFIDLDRFKTINDSLGHHVGDELLKQVAERLGACVRKGDTLSRLGGDEFVVSLEGLKAARDATIVAEKILQALARPCDIEGHTLHSTCSIGISIYPADGADIKTLMRNADTAMYHAKEKGRNSFQFFSHDMNVRVVERLNLETALRRALEREEFMLHYQPQVDLKSGRVVGAEALIRWQHPQQGLISPATFIPVAEESGLIVPIGEWVLFAACTQGRDWTTQGHEQLRMGVNLSVRQLNRDLVKILGEIVKATGFDPHRLDLEITESLLMRNVKDSIEALNALNKLGVQIAIDDFGTGYSSLNYLRRLPIDAIKIDCSFIRDLGISRDDAAIVAAIIAMARSLQIRVIAEGVESPNQLEILGSMQCDEYQGYLFGKPVPAEEFMARHLAAKAPRSLSSKR